jgi:hypothetical protein
MKKYRFIDLHKKDILPEDVNASITGPLVDMFGPAAEPVLLALKLAREKKRYGDIDCYVLQNGALIPFGNYKLQYGVVVRSNFYREQGSSIKFDKEKLKIEVINRVTVQNDDVDFGNVKGK